MIEILPNWDYGTGLSHIKIYDVGANETMWMQGGTASSSNNLVGMRGGASLVFINQDTSSSYANVAGTALINATVGTSGSFNVVQGTATTFLALTSSDLSFNQGGHAYGHLTFSSSSLGLTFFQGDAPYSGLLFNTTYTSLTAGTNTGLTLNSSGLSTLLGSFYVADPTNTTVNYVAIGGASSVVHFQGQVGSGYVYNTLLTLNKSNGSFTINPDGILYFTNSIGQYNFANLPTSASGLPSGSLWKDLVGTGGVTGIVRIV
jgi:hypothetical protein